MKICIMDSDPEQLSNVEKLLEADGCQVLCIDKVIGVSNRIRKFCPDLLVVDVDMPAVSGSKLIEVLRENLHKMPKLVLYSDMDMDYDKLSIMARATKADDYIVKEDNYISLLNRVRFHLGRKSKV